MQVGRAIESLVQVLGEACGGRRGDNHTSMGESLLKTQVNYTASKAIVLHGDGAAGGKVYMKLGGVAQPEAARVLDSVLSLAMAAAKIPDADKNHRYATTDRNNTGREISFIVPDDKADVFANMVDHLTRKIQNSRTLSQQCHQAVMFSLGTISKIEEIKPLIHLIVPPDADPNKPAIPYFRLYLEGTPDELARKLAVTMNKDMSEFEPSDKRHNRNRTKEFEGGYDVRIRMNADYTAAALSDIETYARIAKQVKLPGRKPDLKALPDH